MIVSGPSDFLDDINVVVSGGIFSVFGATCGPVCYACGPALDSFDLTPSPVASLVSGTTQMTATATFSTGEQTNYTSSSYSTWSSNNTPVATVATGGMVTAVAAGSATVQDEIVYTEAVRVCVPNTCPIVHFTAPAPVTVQVPTYFTPTAAGALLNASCPGKGYFAYVDYQVSDQYGNPIQVSGMTPEESVSVNGGPFSSFASFATPVSTGAEGTFEDTPLGTCFSVAPPPNLCIPVVQHFELIMPGVSAPYPIRTVTSRSDCQEGIQITINPPAPPPAPAVTYTFGTVN